MVAGRWLSASGGGALISVHIIRQAILARPQAVDIVAAVGGVQHTPAKGRHPDSRARESGKSGLFSVRQFGARQAEVAQLVLDVR